MKKLLISVACIGILFLYSSCTKKKENIPPPPDCTSAPKSFSSNVNPVIQSVCNTIDCHNSSSANGPGPLTNYTEVFNARSQVRQAIASGFMPRNSSLTMAQKNAILCWIDSGAPNN